MNSQKPPVNVSADVLLVTAVSSEFDALKAAAKDRRLPWEKRRGEAAEYFVLGEVGAQRVAVIRLKSMGSFSRSGSAFTCYRAMLETGATSVIAVGIAFGVDEGTQKIGDILLPKSLHMYDEVDVVDEGEGYRYVYPERASVPASEVWVERFRKTWHDRARVGAPMGRLHMGRLLAGGARIESKGFRQHLCDRVGSDGGLVIGGEMEAAGVAAACAASGGSWALVKAVSDFATKESRARIEETREVAAASAADFTLATLLATNEY